MNSMGVISPMVLCVRSFIFSTPGINHDQSPVFSSNWRRFFTSLTSRPSYFVRHLIEGGIRDAVLPTQVLNTHPGLGILQQSNYPFGP